MRRSPVSRPPRPGSSGWAPQRAAGVVALLLVPVSVGLSTPANPAVPAAVPAAGADQDRVRLLRDAGSPVLAAEVGLSAGTSRLETSTYSMVAATWRGPAPSVDVRTAPGEPWRRLPVLEDGPSAGSGEGTPGLHGTDLVWTGEAAGIDVRVTGTGHRDLELVLIDPGELASDAAAAPSARVGDGEPRAARAPRAASAPMPRLATRQAWDADPRWRNGRPRYNKGLRQVHVHHTATGNRYGRRDVPGLLRGMYRYHTKTLGWFDIGYNFLVDRFGRAWVGRSGGAQRLVRGAHTLGFNHESVGIAVIGTFTRQAPPQAAVRTVVRLAAWKLDRRGRDAVGTVRTTSTGSDRYRRGARPRLPVIDGHRDTNDTACPGRRLYRMLPAIRRQAQRRIDRFG